MFRRQENSMSNPAYDTGAGKRKASLTLNADLYAKAKAVGINLSKVAEEAVAQALAERLAEQARADIHQDLRALNAFVEANGSFAEMVCKHYATVDRDAPLAVGPAAGH
jgi:post-segregation antitoxin (ccd killing protein)